VNRWERRLVREGMPAEPHAEPSWRTVRPHLLPNQASRRIVHVQLPSDRDNYQQTVLDRARHFLCDAEFSPGYNARLEELYWRGDWRCYPRWHRQLVFAHVNDGTTVAEFSRARKLPYAQVWRALEQHKKRAGIGGGDMGGNVSSMNGGKEQASRVEQTAAVRVKVIFPDRLDAHLGLGNIKYAEGELVMGGRFVRIEFQPDKPHPQHDHVLIPVGPGVQIAVLKD
jgi:hypothetical protein